MRLELADCCRFHNSFLLVSPLTWKSTNDGDGSEMLLKLSVITNGSTNSHGAAFVWSVFQGRWSFLTTNDNVKFVSFVSKSVTVVTDRDYKLSKLSQLGLTN